MMQYTSELAASALRLEPEGTPHSDKPCVCAMCQRPLKPGDISSPKTLSRTFMDFGHLAQSDYLCGFCAATAKQNVMRELQRSVITPDGIYNINTDDARAWLWLTPPAPPYAVVINHNTMGAFHYYWRTPVTLDNALVFLNVDGTIYQVRRQRVLKALECAKTLLDVAQTLQTKRKTLKSPFAVIVRDPGSKPRSNHGRLAPEILAMRNSHPQYVADIDFLDNLSTGELIALSPMLKQTPATPTQPELTRSLNT